MSKILNSLNEKQKEAVLYNDGPLAIIAGAGSGKTKTITHKIAYLINEKKINPSRILAVTFTNKAANEMRERVSKLVDINLKNIIISTYHSFSVRILREDIDLLGYRKNFNIIDNVDQKQILRPAYKNLGLSPRTIPFPRTIGMISKFKNARLTPEEVEQEAQKDIDFAYANLYKYYLEQQKATHSLDFDDLLFYAERLLKDRTIAEKWEKRFDYVLVDEFQDTSKVQYSIIKAVGQNSIFTAVGDPDQNIYTWRNADPNLIINFSKKIQKNKTILLEQNYRSTKTILEAANKLIKNNKNRIHKNLFTTSEEGAKIDYCHNFSEESEARRISKKIEDLIQNGEKESDIAIFYRSNFLTNSIEKSLIISNLNYVIYGAIKFYQREEIKDVIAYLKLINSGDAISLKRVINVPARFIGATTQEKIFSQLNRYNSDLFNSLVDNFENIDIKTKSKLELTKFINLIIKYRHALKTNSIKDVIEKFLIEVNYNRKWSHFELKSRSENINELINNISIWEENNKNGTLSDFINETSLYLDYEKQGKRTKNAISLMTVHASKGLEFKHVFLLGMNEDIFPSQKTKEETSFNGMEEERRLAYVAVTRAKKQLYISSSAGLNHQGSRKVPSRFIKELGINPKEHSRFFISEKDYFYTNKRKENNFIDGDYIIHDKFGRGIILKVEGSIVKVAFKSPYGIKSIVKNHHMIKKEEA